ncbi:MAG: transporter associated domain-containing protein, partial [Anaerovoracaceae bacterium]
MDIESILRKAYFVPDTKNIDSLLFELQKSKQQIAVLIDEYGGFSGIVTMEDIIEEVVGDIDDEYDEEAEIIDKVDDSTYLVDGDVDLDDLDEELGIDLQSDSSETIGGFIIDMLGEIPDE